MRGAVQAGITYSLLFEEFEACVAAGLNLWDWVNHRYPIPFKAQVIAWRRMHNLVELHTQDAINREMQRQAKRKRR